MQDTKLPYVLRLNPLYIIFGSLFLLIVPFLIWANYAKLDQKSTTQGIVITTAKTQKIQAAIDGVVDDIFVKEGQRVKAGDLLISLEKETQTTKSRSIWGRSCLSKRVRKKRV